MVTKEVNNNDILLHVDDLKMHFPIYRGVFQRQVGAVRAVDGVSFDVKRGETLGLVGESGCGKSTTGRAILQLYKPTAGSINFDGTDLVNLKGEQMRQMRRKMQMIFQDPYASLNPRMTVAQLVGEPLMVHNVATGAEINERVEHLLELVNLNPAFASRYPPENSCG
jgi:oligopeptide transport system ATP-binding protein